MSGAVRVALASELAEGETRKFTLEIGGRPVECFLVRFRGELHAWVNRCRHVAMSMDWVEGRFFDAEKRFLVCQTHGACYEPATGECVGGPPLGRFLLRVPLELRGAEVWARPPGDDPGPAIDEPDGAPGAQSGSSPK